MAAPYKFHFPNYPDSSVVELVKTCTVTQKEYSLRISGNDYLDWKRRGVLIQDAFPKFTDEQREFIMTGTTPAEWKKLFPEDEEDEGSCTRCGCPSHETYCSNCERELTEIDKTLTKRE